MRDDAVAETTPILRLRKLFHCLLSLDASQSQTEERTARRGEGEEETQEQSKVSLEALSI